MFTKSVGYTGETMQYKVTESLINGQDAYNIKFDTYLYDDFIQIDVFHKGKCQNNTKLGKTFVSVRDLQAKTFDPAGSANSKRALIVPIKFMPSNYSENKVMVNGHIFLRVEYTPRDMSLFDPEWPLRVKNSHPCVMDSELDKFDRFEHFNDFLENDFISQCQFGMLLIDLVSVKIPYMNSNDQES